MIMDVKSKVVGIKTHKFLKMKYQFYPVMQSIAFSDLTLYNHLQIYPHSLGYSFFNNPLNSSEITGPSTSFPSLFLSAFLLSTSSTVP